MDDTGDRGYARAPELEDLAALCRALNEAGARYLLVGGFAVILQGYVRATKDIDLLVDASPANVQALKRAMANLPDNAIALVDDDDVARYGVVRVADEFVVDLMARACGIDYAAAIATGVDRFRVAEVEIPTATKASLIRMKDTLRPSDRADVAYLRAALDEESRQGR